MRKLFLATLTLLCAGTGAFAQYNSRIQLQLGNFTAISNTSTIMPATYNNNVGASVQRSVYKNIGIKVNYQRWTSLIDQVLNSAHSSPSYMDFAVYYNGTGNAIYRGNYNMIDATPLYAKQFGRHHEVFGSIGPSVAWGNIGVGYQNEFHVETVFVGESGWEYVEPIRRRSIEVGAVAEAGYSYRIGRISTGMSGAYRFYGKEFTTINLQLNIGYNFNSFK